MAGGGSPWWRHHREGRFEFGFTDARTDLAPRGAVDSPTPGESSDAVTRALGPHVGHDAIALMHQVHGHHVALAAPGHTPQSDALVIDRPGVAAVVRVADCTPLVVLAQDAPLAAVVHAGRVGMVSGIVAATCEALRARGASTLSARVGPRACGRCYEVDPVMAEEVAAIEPATRSTTPWDTPALDVGAGVIAQLERAGVEIHDLGAQHCTIEDETFWSYRRQGAAAGRFGAVVRMHSEEF